MIAVDSSTLIAFIEGHRGTDVSSFIASLQAGDIVLPPVVLCEILSEPSLPPKHRSLVMKVAVLDVLEGYWVRAADSRAKMLSQKLRVRLPDTLIAQSCIDHDLPLLTRDADFRHFAKHCGLKLA